MKQSSTLIALMILFGSATCNAYGEPDETVANRKKKQPTIPLTEHPCSLEKLLGSPDSLRISSNDSASESEWHSWKLDVAGVVKLKFFKLASKANISCYANLEATIRYKVKKNGEIMEAEVTVPSSNPRFDAAVLESVWALKGNPVLKFPKGAMQESIELLYPVSNSIRLPRSFTNIE